MNFNSQHPCTKTIPVDSIFTAGPLFNRCPSAAPATTSFRALTGPNSRQDFSCLVWFPSKEFVFFFPPEELESCEGRIHYELLKGEGPAVGWVSQEAPKQGAAGAGEAEGGRVGEGSTPSAFCLVDKEHSMWFGVCVCVAA